MEFLSMPELLLWVQVNAPKVVVARNVSNIILLSYLVAYCANRKGCYIVAFLFIEVSGNLSITEALTNSQYYLMYAMLYCSIYWYGSNKSFTFKTLSGYVIMVIFQLCMAADAYFYPETETVIYQCYEYIVMAIHLYIITTLFRWRKIRRNMGDYLVGSFGINSDNYNITFFCYNFKKANRTSR